MDQKVLVIIGSTREDSHTAKAVRELIPFEKYDIIELHRKNIGYYSYDFDKNKSDDFQAIAKTLLNYDVFVFATPVYWYSMSGQLKVFFDRMAELTNQYKPIGKGLKGRHVYAIASGQQPELPEGFEIPFKLSAEYFDMEFKQIFYQRNREGEPNSRL